MHRTIRLPSILVFLLTLVAGVIASACEKDDEQDDKQDDARYDSCANTIAKSDICSGLAWEGCGDCITECADRGAGVAAKDALCGELWLNAYACIAALSCDEYNLWRVGVPETAPYPCDDEESAFREECPGLPLHRDET